MSGPIEAKLKSREDIKRLTELGRLSASLLHEISNPLSVALIHLDQLSDQESLEIKHIRRNLQRLNKYIEAARGQMSYANDQYFFINPQLNDVKRLVKPAARVAKVRLNFELAPTIKLKGDPLKFQQILVNLIMNAIEAYSKEDYLVSKRLVELNFLVKDSLIIKVIDYGSVISKDTMPKLFQPFYTTKGPSENGLGLGLFIVKRYVEENFNGKIRVYSNLRSGTCFIVSFPIENNYKICHK